MPVARRNTPTQTAIWRKHWSESTIFCWSNTWQVLGVNETTNPRQFSPFPNAAWTLRRWLGWSLTWWSSLSRLVSFTYGKLQSSKINVWTFQSCFNIYIYTVYSTEVFHMVINRLSHGFWWLALLRMLSNVAVSLLHCAVRSCESTATNREPVLFANPEVALKLCHISTCFCLW